MTDLKTNPTMSDDETPAREPRPKVEISGPQLVGGALAASTAAILGSQLGTAGTVLGAGLASAISGVATTFYSAGLQRTAHGLRLVVDRRRRPQHDEAPEHQSGPRSAGSTQARPVRRTAMIAALSVIATAVATFVLTMLAVTGLETATGRGLDGGDSPTVTRIVPAATVSGDPTPSTDVSEPAASASPTPSETAGVDVSSPEPTQTETQDSAAVDEPSASPTPDETTSASNPAPTSTGDSTSAPATTEPPEQGQAG